MRPRQSYQKYIFCFLGMIQIPPNNIFPVEHILHKSESKVGSDSWHPNTDLKNLLGEIFKVYNPSTQVKLAFQMLADKSQFKYKDIDNNLQHLKNYFLNDTNYGPKFIHSILGSTYGIDDPICSRFEKNGKKVWVAQEIQNLELKGLVEFKKDQSGKIKVNWHNKILCT